MKRKTVENLKVFGAAWVTIALVLGLAAVLAWLGPSNWKDWYVLLFMTVFVFGYLGFKYAADLKSARGFLTFTALLASHLTLYTYVLRSRTGISAVQYLLITPLEGVFCAFVLVLVRGTARRRR